MSASMPTEPVQVVVDHGGVNMADWIGLALTAALVVITGVYVWHTRRMADRMDDQLAAIREQQQLSETARLREKSDRGAYECLDAIQGLLAEYEARPPGAVDRGTFDTARLQIRRAAPLVHDLEVRKYLDTFREVTFIGSFTQEQIERERLDAGVVRLIARDMAERLTTVLHAYLSEQPIPDNVWMRNSEDDQDDYPDPSDAASWVRTYARRERT